MTTDDEFDWWPLINQRAALKEQFPSFKKVVTERPGSATDRERKRLYQEMTELSKAREQQARLDAIAAEQAKRRERAENRARAKAYKAYRTTNQTPAQSGVSFSHGAVA